MTPSTPPAWNANEASVPPGPAGTGHLNAPGHAGSGPLGSPGYVPPSGQQPASANPSGQGPAPANPSEQQPGPNPAAHAQTSAAYASTAHDAGNAGSTWPAPASAVRKRRGLMAVPAAALLAALASSGLTYAVVDGTGHSSAPSNSTTTTRVVQGNTSAPDWTVTAAAVAPSVVAIDVQGTQGEAEGSGVVLDTSGHIATNNHVVASLGTGAKIQVTMSDHRVYDATIVGTDVSTDLAVLKLVNGPADVHPISLADVAGLKVGQPVMALGNPLGLNETVTTGIISALDRPVITQQSQAQDQQRSRQSSTDTSQQAVTNAIQTSAAINPGNSGGALVDANGKLIGITSSIASLGSSAGESGNIGIGFAIPADQVQAVTQQLIESGRASHPYLGVSAADAVADTPRGRLSGAGVRVVAPGGPAAQAGLRIGDVITAINGEPVSASEALVAQVRNHRVGDQVELTVMRGGQETKLPVTLVQAPN